MSQKPIAHGPIRQGDDQLVTYRVRDIAVEIVRVRDVELGCQPQSTVHPHLEVHMSWPPTVLAEHVEQFAVRTVISDLVSVRDHSLYVVSAVGVGDHLAAQVVPHDVIDPVLIGLPDVDLCERYGFAGLMERYPPSDCEQLGVRTGWNVQEPATRPDRSVRLVKRTFEAWHGAAHFSSHGLEARHREHDVKELGE